MPSVLSSCILAVDYKGDGFGTVSDQGNNSKHTATRSNRTGGF